MRSSGTLSRMVPSARCCHVAHDGALTLFAAARLQVYKGLRRGVHEVAVKQLGNLKDPQLIRQFRKEIAILGRVSFQPNIVNFYGACLRNPANIMLVMELMEGGF
jgi:serine/threonine protein kinase